MVLQHAGKEYLIQFGSDVANDGVYLELAHRSDGANILLTAFRSDATEKVTFFAHHEDAIPFEIVENFVAEVRKSLYFSGRSDGQIVDEYA